MEIFGNVATNGVKHRRDAEKCARENGDGRGESEDAPIDRNCNYVRDVHIENVPREDGEQEAGGEVRDDESDGATDAGEQKAFGEELRNHARARGAERGADGDFTAASDDAREGEVRDVGAGDEKNEANRSEQNQKRKADVTVELFAQRNDFYGVAGVACGMLGCDA